MLSSLELYGNRIKAVMMKNIADARFCSMVLLSTGDWPQLEVLCLSENGVDVTTLPALAKSKWPSLSYLNLADNLLSRGDFRLMGGDATCDEPRDMCRHVWPKLHRLEY